MRRANSAGWLKDDKDHIFGLNLGADYCAEHEWGIRGLREILEINEDNRTVFGIERRRAKPRPECVCLMGWGDSINFLCHSTHEIEYFSTHPAILDDHEYAFCEYSEPPDLITAWAERGFLIRGRNQEQAPICLLYEHFIAGKTAVWLGGGGIFQNAGLCIAIIDHTPETAKQTMYDADKDHYALELESAAIDIKTKIDALNNACKGWDKPFGYFSLRPDWAHKDMTTKHKVCYWLNPEHQNRVNYGWFTVEDLEAWLIGEGPIPKTKKERENIA